MGTHFIGLQLTRRLYRTPDLMIMGESGSGKTYSAQCLIAELAQKNIPSVIFDYGQSFELETVEQVFRKFAAPREAFNWRAWAST